MGLAFLCSCRSPATTGKAVPALLVVLCIMAVFAVSELLLSPIGLSVTTKLAPDAFRAQMMALYFFSVGLGTSMSGVLAGTTTRPTNSPTSGSSVRSPWSPAWSCSRFAVDQPADGGRALLRLSAWPSRDPTETEIAHNQVSMGTGWQYAR